MKGNKEEWLKLVWPHSGASYLNLLLPGGTLPIFKSVIPKKKQRRVCRNVASSRRLPLIGDKTGLKRASPLAQGLKLQSQSAVVVKACRVPHLTVKHVFNGRLTYIANKRINFANEGSQWKREEKKHERKKGNKKKKKKKTEEPGCFCGRVSVLTELRVLTTCTKRTLVLGTCYSPRNTVRTSCQRQVPAYGYTHTSSPSSAGSRNRAKIELLRHQALMSRRRYRNRYTRSSRRVSVPLIRRLSSD